MKTTKMMLASLFGVFVMNSCGSKKENSQVKDSENNVLVSCEARNENKKSHLVQITKPNYYTILTVHKTKSPSSEVIYQRELLNSKEYLNDPSLPDAKKKEIKDALWHFQIQADTGGFESMQQPSASEFNLVLMLVGKIYMMPSKFVSNVGALTVKEEKEGIVQGDFKMDATLHGCNVDQKKIDALLTSNKY